MNKEEFQAIYDRLIEIKNNINVNNDFGICKNLIYRINIKDAHKPINWLENNFYKWPRCFMKNDGMPDGMYPVGGEEEHEKSNKFKNHFDNPRRLELLDFLISQASKELSI